MKVKCISTGKYRHITLHKIYFVLSNGDAWFEIDNDIGYTTIYGKHLFVQLKEEDMKCNGVDASGKPKNFTDADLKEGMVVKLRNDETGMLTMSGRDLAVSFFDYSPYNSWVSQASLKHFCDSKWDIVEVYMKRQPSNFFDKTLEDDILVWKANPILTEQEQRIQELEYTIAKAQEQIQELKGALK